MDPRTRLLLEAPVGRTIVRLALPNVLVMVVQASIGLIETYFVAKLGVDALAAMALVFPLFMLLQMVSAGAMGGGILSAIARALGSGGRERANELVWSAVAITIGLGALTTAAALLGGPWLYAFMGGRDASLAAAVTYSSLIFAGAIPLWLLNSFAAIIRGTGNMFFPACVICVGAIVLIPLSAVLIFGLGPFPRLGIAGGATAVLFYYVIGCSIFATYIWSGRGVLKPSLRPPRLTWAPMRDILRVGTASSIVSISTNLSIAAATGLAGLIGPAAVAGYGTGARLEYLLVPMVFGLGAPVAAMVGTSIGAGNRQRALTVAWTGAAIAGGFTELIGDCGGTHAARMADPVRQQRADGRGRSTLFADRRTLLWLLRRWARSIFCIARRGSVGLADGRGGRTGCRCRGRRLACGQISRWKRRTIYLTCNSARDIRRHQCVGGRGWRVV